MKSKRSLLFLGTSLLASFLLLFFLSENSPAFPINRWTDANIFFSIGREILKGKVIYRDLYEQKGPVLFFVWAAAALLNDKSFTGYFCIEVLSFTLYLFYSMKTASLFLTKKSEICLAGVLLGAITCLSNAFSFGGSLEELFLFTVPWLFYCILSHTRKNEPISYPDVMLAAMLASLLFWSKYTICSIFIVPVLFLLPYTAKFGKKRLVWTIVQFGAVFLGVSGLILFYFWKNNALQDMWTTYFYDNIFIYPSARDEIARYDGVKKLTNNGLITYVVNLGCFISLVLGISIFRKRRLLKKKEWIFLISSFGVTFLLTCLVGKYYAYYYLILAPFSLFGAIGVLLEKDKRTNFLLLLSVFAAIACSYSRQETFGDLFKKKEDTVQYEFASLIEKDATLLQYMSLDGGFYLAAGKDLPVKYYCCFNAAPHEMYEVQNACILNGLTDYVVTANFDMETLDFEAPYEEIASRKEAYEGETYTYRLYKKVQQNE